MMLIPLLSFLVVQLTNLSSLNIASGDNLIYALGTFVSILLFLTPFLVSPTILKPFKDKSIPILTNLYKVVLKSVALTLP